MSTKKLCTVGLLIAFTCIATMIIKIPTPGTQGYVNVGDCMVLVSAVFFGPEVGFIAGGLGSALADLLNGYTQWAAATFIIKGIEGYVAAKIAGKFDPHRSFFTKRMVIACIIAVVIMVLGYLIGGTVIEGSFYTSLGSVPANCVQAVASLIIFGFLGLALYKAGVYRFFRD